ncbi:hypothetical protein Ancab_012957 [Ancistrocladus abbreviatus]
MASCLPCYCNSKATTSTPTVTRTRRKRSTLEALPLLQRFTITGSSQLLLKQIHAKIIRNNILHSNSNDDHDHLLLLKLLRLYTSFSNIDCANALFKQMEEPPTYAWNLMIRGHTINGTSSRQALVLYNLMVTRAIPPDKFTFPFTIKACASCEATHKGKEVHGLAIKAGFSKDIFLQHALMDFYFKCGEFDFGCKVFDKMRVRNVVSWTTMLTGLIRYGQLDSARRLFHRMPVRNVVSWSAMIDACVINGRPYAAFELFKKMQVEEGVKPNEFTLVSLLRACTALGSLKLGAWVHDYGVKNGFELGLYLGTALVDMYSKCGNLGEARRVFDKMENKSLATWNSMITSFGVHGCGREALVLFQRMREENVQPDAITFAGVLRACVQTKDVDEGLRCFRYMIEGCGIVPILEHYICMFQLWDHAKTLQRTS